MPDYSACIDKACPSRASCARYLMVWNTIQQLVTDYERSGDRCYAFMAAEDAPFRLVSVNSADERGEQMAGMIEPDLLEVSK